MILNGECLHIVLFGTFGENKYFLSEYRDAYDLIGINGNMIAFAPDGMAGFILQLKNKRFFIDPQTHAFQQPLKTIMTKKIDEDTKKTEWVLKRSVENLANCYGSVIASSVGSRRLTPDDITSDNIGEICTNVLNFELTAIADACKKLAAWEFVQVTGADLLPTFLISPYFYVTADGAAKQLKANIGFVAESRKCLQVNALAKGRPLFAELVIDRDVVVDAASLKEVIDSYASCDCDGFILWIDDFSEVEASTDLLAKYVHLLKELGKGAKPILTLHGSFLSVALSGRAFGLAAGVGHGMEYGESRPVVPVGGGVPLAKYYFPRFHKRVNYSPDAEDVLLESKWDSGRRVFLSEVCNCQVCSEVILDEVQKSFARYGDTKISEKDGKAYPTAEAMDLSRRHYLAAKISEYKLCRTASRDELVDLLRLHSDVASKIRSHSFDHVARWHNILSEHA